MDDLPNEIPVAEELMVAIPQTAGASLSETWGTTQLEFEQAFAGYVYVPLVGEGDVQHLDEAESLAALTLPTPDDRWTTQVGTEVLLERTEGPSGVPSASQTFTSVWTATQWQASSSWAVEAAVRADAFDVSGDAALMPAPTGRLVFMPSDAIQLSMATGLTPRTPALVVLGQDDGTPVRIDEITGALVVPAGVTVRAAAFRAGIDDTPILGVTGVGEWSPVAGLALLADASRVGASTLGTVGVSVQQVAAGPALLSSGVRVMAAGPIATVVSAGAEIGRTTLGFELSDAPGLPGDAAELVHEMAFDPSALSIGGPERALDAGLPIAARLSLEHTF